MVGSRGQSQSSYRFVVVHVDRHSRHPVLTEMYPPSSGDIACLPVMRPIVLVISRKISRMFSKMTAPSVTQSTTDPNSAFCLDNVSGSGHLRRTGSMRELLNTDDPDEGVNDGPGHKLNALVDITSTATQPRNLKPARSTLL